MSAFMFMWRASDHTMIEAIECGATDFKLNNIVELGFADCLDLVEAAQTAANCLGRENDLGVGITYSNYYLDLTPEVLDQFEDIGFLCPTELFKPYNLARLKPNVYDKDKKMTISVVCWDGNLYSSIEEAFHNGALVRLDDPINASSSEALNSTINAMIAGSSVYSYSPLGVAIEKGDEYLDLSIVGGMEMFSQHPFHYIEDAFEMEVYKQHYLKEIK